MFISASLPEEYSKNNVHWSLNPCR